MWTKSWPSIGAGWPVRAPRYGPGRWGATCASHRRPSHGLQLDPYWRLVSAVGASCVDANALSTAAVVWGDQAIERLRPFDQAVRLLRHDGEVFTLGGWPEAGQS